jgi:hypothetical protein
MFTEFFLGVKKDRGVTLTSQPPLKISPTPVFDPRTVQSIAIHFD